MSSPTQPSIAGRIATVGLIVAIVGVIIAGLALPGQLGWLRNLLGAGEPEACEQTCASQLKVTCSLPGGVRAGVEVKLTYVIDSPTNTMVGIGTGVYDEGSTDRSDGSGDKDTYSLKSGENSVPITIVPPKGLKAGQYEVVAELWQPGNVGNGNTLTDSSCGTFKVGK